MRNPELLLIRIFMGFFVVFLSVPAPAWIVAARAAGANVEGPVLAIGTARLRDGNLAAARQQALADALRKGVEQELLRRLDAEVIAGRISRFVEELVPAAGEEIANYNILGEEETGGVVRVLVRLRANAQTLESVLREKGFVAEHFAPLRVLFVVSLRGVGFEHPVHWWRDFDGEAGALQPLDLSLTRAFEAMGFNPVSRTFDPPSGGGKERMRGADLGEQELLEWGRLSSADVVIGGSCVRSEGMVSIFLKALDVAAGSVMAEHGAQSVLDPALEDPERLHDGIERVVRAAGSELGPRIREAFRPVETEPLRLTLILEGVGNFAQLQAFSRFVEGGAGVESLTQTRFKGDSVTFSVGYRGGSDDFLESLLNHPAPPFPMTAHTNEAGEIVVSPL
jgi:hypothetical protein